MVLINVYSVMKDVTARKNNQNRLIFKKTRNNHIRYTALAKTKSSGIPVGDFLVTSFRVPIRNVHNIYAAIFVYKLCE